MILQHILHNTLIIFNTLLPRAGEALILKNNFINMLSDVERNTPHCTLNADTEEKSRLLVFSMEAGLTMIIFNS